MKYPIVLIEGSSPYEEMPQRWMVCLNAAQFFHMKVDWAFRGHFLIWYRAFKQNSTKVTKKEWKPADVRQILQFTCVY